MRRFHSSLFKIAVLGSVCLAAIGTGHAETCKGGASTTLKVNGDVTNKAEYTLTDLKNFRLDPAAEYTPTTLTVTFNSSQGKVTSTYTGIPLIDLLTAANIKVNKKQKNDILRKYVIAHATDCYEAVIALGEFLPKVEGKKVLVAYEDGSGQPLADSEGMVHLIVPGDVAGGRYVYHLSRLTVRSAAK